MLDASVVSASRARVPSRREDSGSDGDASFGEAEAGFGDGDGEHGVRVEHKRQGIGFRGQG